MTCCPVPRGLFSVIILKGQKTDGKASNPLTWTSENRGQARGELLGLECQRGLSQKKKKMAEAESYSQALKELFVTMIHQATLFYMWSSYVNFLPQKEKSLSD